LYRALIDEPFFSLYGLLIIGLPVRGVLKQVQHDLDVPVINKKAMSPKTHRYKYFYYSLKIPQSAFRLPQLNQQPHRFLKQRF
jgi:hypothetical protein